MADLLEELKARTVAGVQPVRGLNYNYPQRLFMKPDGTVVSLQGDPQNRAYYRDKGYIELSEVRPPAGGLSERQRYEQEFRPALIAAQREKAEVINTIRRIGQHNPSLNVDYPWESLSTAQCREIMDGLSTKTGMPTNVYAVPIPTEPPPAEDGLLTGVETAATASLEGLQAKLANPQGYDPIDQAARPVRQRMPHGPS
jgi:hypothetical protein